MKNLVSIKFVNIFFGVLFGEYTILKILGLFNVFDENKFQEFGLNGAMLLVIFSLIITAIYGYFSIRPIFKTKIYLFIYDKRLPFITLFLAKKLGYFKKHSIKVNFIITHNDATSWERVKESTEKDIRLALGDPYSMITDSEKHGKIIGNLIHKPCLYGVTRKKIPYITNFADLNGMTLAIYSQPSTSFFLLINLLKEKGVSNIKIIEFNPSELMNIIDNSEIDIIFVNEPRATYLEKFSFYQVLNLAKEIDEFMMSSIFTSNETLKLHTKTINKFLDVIDMALSDVHKDFHKLLKISSSEFENYNKNDIYKALINLYSEEVFPKNSKVRLSSWENYVKYRYSKSDSTKHRMFEENIWNSTEEI